MGVRKQIGKSIYRRIDSLFGKWLRSKFASFNVTRPYVVNINRVKELDGKVAVVTGGSGAIGRACSFRLAAEGAKVYVCGSRPGSATSVVEEIRNAGYNAECVHMDVTDEVSVGKTIEAIFAENGGHLDILVCAAGGSAREKTKPLCEQEMKVIDNVLDVNLRGTVVCAKAAISGMKTGGYGRIIIITSIIGMQGKAGFCEYAASKGGSIALVKSLAQEVGHYGITVNGVAPGIVQRGCVTEEQANCLSETNYLGTYGKPEDIASLVTYLCKEEASFLTGQNIAVDGGRSLGVHE